MARKPVLAIDPKEVASALAEVPRRERTPDRARYEAQAFYVTHPDGVTLEELSRTPHLQAQGVTIDQLKEWSRQDGWVEERRRVLEGFGDKLKDQLQRALYSRITKVRVHQLDVVSSLKADLVSKALSAEVKSAEAAAKVVVDLMKHELDLSAGIAQEMMPASGGAVIEARNSLTEEEVLHAARIVLAKRRQGQTVTIQTSPQPKQIGGPDAPTSPTGGATPEPMDP